MSFKQAFVCDDCGREARAQDGDRHTSHKDGELSAWFHVDHMGSNAHIWHFCTLTCLATWAMRQGGLTNISVQKADEQAGTATATKGG